MSTEKSVEEFMYDEAGDFAPSAEVLHKSDVEKLIQAERTKREVRVREAFEEAGNYVDELYQTGNMGDNEHMLLTAFFDEKLGTHLKKN